MKISTVDRGKIAKAIQIHRMLVAPEWLTPTEQHALVDRDWFIGIHGPAIQQHLRSLKKANGGTLEHNPGNPGWNCIYQCFSAMAYSKEENAKQGGDEFNIAIGLYAFYPPLSDPIDGHAVVVAFFGNSAICKPVFWDITGAREYTLTDDDKLNGRHLWI